jgi:cation:H+ antiporter
MKKKYFSESRFYMDFLMNVWSVISPYVLLIGGFVLLIKGADWFVDGSSSVAKLLKVPSIIIGLTVVALGTSLPEASVSISSALKGQNALAVSNVVGSNLFNTLVVLGASALIRPVAVQKNSIKKEIPFSILCTFALLGSLFLGHNKATPAGDVSAAVVENTYTLTRIGGLVLVAFFAFYMYWQISSALKARKNGELEEEEDVKTMKPLMSIIAIVGGVACIIIGGNFVVDGASAIAMKFGMSETLVGMTIVAIGTSLPELVTAITSLLKGHGALSLGNIIGANLFNLVLVSGVTTTILPFDVPADSMLAGMPMSLLIDIPVMLSVMAILTVPTLISKKLTRTQGILLLCIYLAFFAVQFII